MNKIFGSIVITLSTIIFNPLSAAEDFSLQCLPQSKRFDDCIKGCDGGGKDPSKEEECAINFVYRIIASPAYYFLYCVKL